MREKKEWIKPATRQRWLRRLLWCVVVVLGLWALAWLALPYVLRTQGERMASEKLGRTVHIGAVQFKPWSLALTVHDVQVAAASGSEPQLSVQRIYVDADIESLLRLAPVLDALEIDQPVLRVAQTAPGQFDFDDVLARLQDQSPKPADDKPAVFALYNIAVKGGAVQFRDDTVGQTHQLTDLHLGVPFISNLASKRTIKVLPQLAFRLNGSEFSSQAEASPFTDGRRLDARLRIKDLDLAPYLAYMPASVPVRLVSGVLQGDVRLAFEQSPQAEVKLSGTLGAAAVQVNDARGQALLQFKQLDVQLVDVQPLARQVHLASVVVDGAQLSLRRGKDGQLQLLDAQGQPPQKLPQKLAPANAANAVAPENTAAGASQASENRQNNQKISDQATLAKATPGWQVQVDALQLSQVQGLWVDDSVPVPARVQLNDFALTASQIRWPLEAPFAFQGQSALAGAPGVPSDGRIVFSGKASAQMAEVQVSTTALPLQLGASYLSGVIEPGVQGTIDSQMQLQWQGAAVRLNLAQLTLSNLALQCNSRANCAAPHGTAMGLKGPTHVLEWQKLLVQDALLDTAARTLVVGSLELVAPVLGVSRNPQGRFMFEDWLPATQVGLASQANAAQADKTPAKTPTAQPDWQVQLESVAIQGAALHYQDEAGPRKVAFKVTGLDVQLRDFAPLADKAKPSPLKIAGRIGTGRAEPGRLVFDGRFGLAPLSLAGRLNMTQLPVHAFAPYAAAALPVRIMRADANFKGRVDFMQSPQGPVLHMAGDAALDDVRVRADAAPAQVQTAVDADDGAPEKGTAGAIPVSEKRQKDQEFSKVKPHSPADADPAGSERSGASMRNSTSSAGLGGAVDDLLRWKILSLRGLALHMAPGERTRLKVSETALSDFYARLIVQENGSLNLQDLGAGVGTTDVPASVTQPDSPVGSSSGSGAAVVGEAGAAAVALGPIIDMGPISISGGAVQFSDRFIKPSYSADLSALAGRMSAFSSEPAAAGQPPQLADLELSGQVEGTASLEVTGQLNPLVKPLVLNIHGKVRDLELSPLSPYSVKYAGHGIERGKLSVDVQYDVQPDGQLTAANKLVLNQLVFGEPVKDASSSLPVKLAVALLADRNGVIDVELPISGSLNDPEFRLAPVIFKVIGNLIVKAITSPFALLSGGFGADSQASQVAFESGSAQLSDATRGYLDQVAQALQDRPALQLTVSGQADLAQEQDGWRQARLADMVLAQKRRQAIRAGGQAQAVEAVSAEQYPALLKDVYRRADIKKPRNLVGMAADLPVSQMQALLMSSIHVPDHAMRELALARSVAVRDYLASQGVPLARLFLGNAKTEGFDKTWTPRAELSLAPR